MTDKILDANDYARANGFLSIHDMLAARDYTRYDTPFKNVEPAGAPVRAFVSFGAWIASCECNGAEYVAPGEPFYCQSCGNYQNGGIGRPVEFPDDRDDIERELLRRPVVFGTGRNEFERMQRQSAAISTEHGYMSRTWLLTETVAELKRQNKHLPKKVRK